MHIYQNKLIPQVGYLGVTTGDTLASLLRIDFQTNQLAWKYLSLMLGSSELNTGPYPFVLVVEASLKTMKTPYYQVEGLYNKSTPMKL